MSIVPLVNAFPIVGSAAVNVSVTVKPCAPNTSTVICAINCSSAKSLLPMESCAPLPLVWVPVGHVCVVLPLLVALLVGLFPPPHAARVPGIAIAITASSLRLMDVFLRMSLTVLTVDLFWDCDALNHREPP